MMRLEEFPVRGYFGSSMLSHFLIIILQIIFKLK